MAECRKNRESFSASPWPVGSPTFDLFVLEFSTL